MITAICSLSQVHGAGLWLLFWLICAAVYFGVCMLIEQNRTGHGVRNVLLALLAAEVIIDIAWAIIFYRNGTYLNHGTGGVFGVLLWIPVLAAASVTVSTINNKDYNNRQGV